MIRNSIASALAIWLLLFAAAALHVLAKADASLLAGEYIPFGYDAFYHAKRILAVAAGEPLSQYDPLMHVPGGSWIPWPWAYDWVLGQGVRLGQWIAPEIAPMQILAYIPLIGLGATLAVTLTCARELGMSWKATVFSGATMVLAPQLLASHLLGAVDHHWAEALAFMSALWTGLRWQRRGDSASAAAHGAVLALALGVQNGMFLLQIFTLVALGSAWIRGSLPAAGMPAFAAALMGCTFALLLPSIPFQMGWTNYYYLGWFHAAAASGTALAALILSRYAPGKGGFVALLSASMLVVVAMAPELRAGGEFIAANTQALDSIQETASVVEAIGKDGLRSYLGANTALPLLAPLALVFIILLSWHDSRARWLLPYAAAGCLLFLLQLRFWSYGLGAAALVVGLGIDRLLARSGEPEPAKWFASLLAAFAVLATGAREVAFQYPLAGSAWFAPMRDLVSTLRPLCEDDSHVILADPNYGHFISYFSDCAVITNNFIIGPHDYAARARAEHLFSLEPREFLQNAGDVDYVLVNTHPGRLKALLAEGRLEAGGETGKLTQRLLDNNRPSPRGFQKVAEAELTIGGAPYAIMRLFRVGASVQESSQSRRSPAEDNGVTD